MLSLKPVTTRIRSLAFGKSTVEQMAVERVELHPASTIFSPPAIALPDEWDRVTQVYVGADPAWERANMEGGQHMHAATVAYLLRDVLVAGQSIYTGWEHLSFATSKEKWIVSGKPERYKSLQLSSSWVSNKYFGHWMMDELPLDLLATERGLQSLSLASREWMHEPGFRRLAGLQRKTAPLARVEELWVVDDRGNNAGRIARIKKLRSLFRRPGSGGPKRIFLDRGQTGADRPLLNSTELVDTLKDAGFHQVFPEKETADSLSQLLSDAEICVAVEGSHMVHANMLMPQGAKLLILVPPQRFSSMQKVYADMVGLTVAYVVGDVAAHPSGTGFTMPLGRIREVLDLLERSPVTA